eukprot:13387329-Ditylum_brightwellii.AAC.1
MGTKSVTLKADTGTTTSPQVCLPNNTIITASQVVQLPLPVQPSATTAHIYPDLCSASLLSIGQLRYSADTSDVEASASVQQIHTPKHNNKSSVSNERRSSISKIITFTESSNALSFSNNINTQSERHSTETSPSNPRVTIAESTNTFYVLEDPNDIEAQTQNHASDYTPTRDASGGDASCNNMLSNSIMTKWRIAFNVAVFGNVYRKLVLPTVAQIASTNISFAKRSQTLFVF